MENSRGQFDCNNKKNLRLILFEKSWSHININILETSKRRDDTDEKYMNASICLRREFRKQDGPVGDGMG